MGALKKVLKFIDLLSERSGHVGKWTAVGLVVVGSFDTIMRHFFNAPSDWAYDVMCMLGGAMYLLGASYDHLHGAHTRVDIFFNMLKPRARALVNVIAAILFFFPLIGMLLYMGIVWAVKAVEVNEVMFTSFWYPPAAPYRILFAVGLFLLLIQGASNFTRDLFSLMRGKDID